MLKLIGAQMRFGAVCSVPMPSSANDNRADRSNAWAKGYADGRRDAWSDHLANQPGVVGQSYLAGWVAGSKAHTP